MNKNTSAAEYSATKWWFLGFASLALFGNYYVYDAAAVASTAFVFAWLLWQREKGPNGHGMEDPR